MGIHKKPLKITRMLQLNLALQRARDAGLWISAFEDNALANRLHGLHEPNNLDFRFFYYDHPNQPRRNITL